MRLSFGLAALLFALALGACSGAKSGALAPLKTTPAEVEAFVAKLSAESFKSQAKGAADLAAVRDALPKAMGLTWGALSFDAASGATVLTDVKLAPADQPSVGLGFAEVRLWDFDADLAKARLAGQRLTETAQLAKRVEAKGISIYGLETLMAPAMEAYSGAVEDAVASVDPSAPPMDMKLEKYDFSIARLILTDLTLRPYELKPAKLPAGDAFAELMPMLQPFAAAFRSFGADAYVMSGVKAQFSMSEMGQAFAVDAGIESIGFRGIRGADTDAGFVRNITFSGNVPGGVTDPVSGVTSPPMSITGGIDYLGQEDTRFDKLYGYLARGEWPPRTETDLLSYGLITFKNEHFAINGHNVFSLGEGTLDARGWHWFIPTKASMKAENLVYDIGGLMQMVEELAPSLAADEGPDGALLQTTASPIPPEVMALMVKYGLDKPSIDMALGWTWNATSGAAVIDTAFGLDNYLRFDLKYDGGFPSFKAVSDLVPDGPSKADGAAIGKVFENATTFTGFELNISEESGGLDKLFALAVEAGKMVPPDQMGDMAMFANQTPQSLRTLAKAGVDMGATQAEQMMPGTGKLVSPFAAWIERGGKVKLIVKPKKPVPLAETTARIERGELSPLQLLDQLGASAVHTPPTGAARP